MFDFDNTVVLRYSEPPYSEFEIFCIKFWALIIVNIIIPRYCQIEFEVYKFKEINNFHINAKMSKNFPFHANKSTIFWSNIK